MIRLRRIAALSTGDLALLARAFLILVRIRVGLSALPWPLFVKFAERSRNPGPTTCSPVRVEWAIRAASRFVPAATCLTQALALRRLLAACGHAASVHIGVAGGTEPFDAHAWVECADGSLLADDTQRARYSRLLSWPPSQHKLFR